jgi:YebC/PmpR family DNA-binding regulatory protein
MAGHSKWANIKHKKAVVDAKRSKFWTKVLREVQVAARLGGADPDANPRLRSSLLDARAQNIPKDTIKRSIERGAGTLEGQDFVELTYEGYGPGGVAVMVECLTDNRNRTASNVRTAFAKADGNMGTDGSVAYIFTKQGKMWFEAGETVDFDEVMMAAIEAGAEDAEEAEGTLEVTTGPYDLPEVRSAMEEAGFSPDRGEVMQVPANEVSLDVATAKKVLGLIDKLEDDDDVQRVSHNLEMTDELLEALS